MSENKIENIIYSTQVIEFVAVAKEFCNLLENAKLLERPDFIIKTHKFLSLLYLKALALPVTELIHEDENETFVTELDWNIICDNVRDRLGRYDSYIDFFDLMMQETPEPVTNSISEHIADVYQDLKNFLSIYQLGIIDLMNDGLHECLQNFGSYWGQRVIASVKKLHHVIYVEGIDLEEEKKEDEKDRDTGDWFITKRQQDYNNGSELS